MSLVPEVFTFFTMLAEGGGYRQLASAGNGAASATIEEGGPVGSMHLYKYLKRQHAKDMLAKGEIKIGTLSQYRTIEDATRTDVNEGRRDSITDFTDGARVTNREEWERTLGFLTGSNINYISGTVQIEPGTRFIGNDDIEDAYIYCTSKVYSRALQGRFQAECCIEIYNPQGFLAAIAEKLSDLGLIHRDLSTGRAVEYIGHAVDSGSVISGNWLKDARYKEEQEFRFSFVPIIRRDGQVIEPLISEQNGVRTFQFPDARDIELRLEPQPITCSRIIRYCRLK